MPVFVYGGLHAACLPYKEFKKILAIGRKKRKHEEQFEWGKFGLSLQDIEYADMAHPERPHSR